MEADSPKPPSNVRDLAKAINLSPTIVQQMVANGEIAKGADGCFDIAAALKVKEERARRQKGGVVYDPELQAIKVQREKNKMALEALELAQKADKVVQKADIVREWSHLMLELKHRLTGLGREIAPLVMGRSPQEVQAIIDGRVFEILRACNKLTVNAGSET